MAYVTPVKCPICGLIHTVLHSDYRPRPNMKTGWWELECPECQEKIDLEQAAKLAEPVHLVDILLPEDKHDIKS